MKTTIIAVLVVIVMGVLTVNRDVLFKALEDASTYETEIEREIEIKEVQPEWATDEDAVKAAKDVLRKKELEAELNALEANFEATTATYEEELNRLKNSYAVSKESYTNRKKELELEIGSY